MTMTMTNAQAALQAAATWYSNDPHLVTLSVTETAGKFKDWLDLQDAKELQDFDKGRPERPSSAGHPDSKYPAGARPDNSTNFSPWGGDT